MKDNKYYVPTVEELCIGYECETKTYIDFDFYKIIINNEIYETDCDGIHEPNCPLYRENMVLFRTKYLDKQDLENEGWVEDKINSDKYRLNLEKDFDNYILGVVYIPEEKELIIYKYIHKKESILFNGKCKSINEFRNIIKYLGI